MTNLKASPIRDSSVAVLHGYPMIAQLEHALTGRDGREGKQHKLEVIFVAKKIIKLFHKLHSHHRLLLCFGNAQMLLMQLIRRTSFVCGQE